MYTCLSVSYRHCVVAELSAFVRNTTQSTHANKANEFLSSRCRGTTSNTAHTARLTIASRKNTYCIFLFPSHYFFSIISPSKKLMTFSINLSSLFSLSLLSKIVVILISLLHILFIIISILLLLSSSIICLLWNL